MSSPDHITPFRPGIRPPQPTDELKRTGPDSEDIVKNERFKRLMRQGSQRPTKEEEEFAAVDEREAEPPSLFDLSANQKAKNKSDSKKPSLFSLSQQKLDEDHPSLTEAMAQEAPPLPGEQDSGEVADSTSQQNEKMTQSQINDLAKQPIKDQFIAGELGRQAVMMQSRKASPDQPSLESGTTAQSSKKDKNKVQNREIIDESQEHIDLAAVNPRIQAMQFSNEKAAMQESDMPRSTTLKLIAAQIIERIQVLRSEGQTDTTITLRNPPIFAGAQLTVTAFDHARGEYNIAFSSLSNEAKLFLDRKLNEDSLSQTLERKGFVVHRLITTTQIENPLNIEKNDLYGRDQERESREEQRGEESSQENT